MVSQSFRQLRPATALDAGRVAEIYLAAVHQAMPWLRLAHSDSQVRRWIRVELLPQHEVWISAQGSAVSGFLALSRDRTWIDQLYVDPSAQGQGHGRALVELAQALSPGQLQLWAFQGNAPARAFYERRGFRAVEFRDGATNEEREPDVRYRWSRSGSERFLQR